MDKNSELLVKIARLYYLEQMNQKDIAKKLHMSMAGVSRSIQKAHSAGIVTISVSGSDNELEELEIAMEKRYGLRECLLVHNSDSLNVMYAEMGRKIGYALDRVLTDSSILGISWGKTLKIMGENLDPGIISCGGVIPIIGAMGMIETGIYPNYISRTFAENLQSDAYLVNTPGVVDSKELKDSITSDSSFKQVSVIWKKLDAILFSVSTMDSEASISTNNIFAKSDLDELKAAGAAVAANFNFLDSEGSTIEHPLQDRLINLSLEQMAQVEHRIMAAAGKQKVDAIAVALKANLCDILITDVQSAKRLT